MFGTFLFLFCRISLAKCGFTQKPKKYTIFLDFHVVFDYMLPSRFTDRKLALLFTFGYNDNSQFIMQ